MDSHPPARSLARLLLSLAAALGAAAAVSVPLRAEPPQVTRGPYLQSGAGDRVVVRWRTDLASYGTVRFGTSADALDQRADEAFPAVDHEVELTGLESDTRYFYSVGTADEALAGGDPDHSFRTSPGPATPRGTRVWVLGDSGTRSADARAVRDGFAQFAGGRPPDLWLMLGDNAYFAGTDAEYQGAVFEMYPDSLRTAVLWPAFGNHDGGSSDAATETGPYFEIFTLPRAAEAGGLPSATEAYYSFDYGNVHFVCLDSAESETSPGSAMASWLEADLLTASADWIVAFWHHPPYTKGSHDSDSEARLERVREDLLPTLEELGVDLVLAGHSHSYERSILLDGHYGSSETYSVAQHAVDAGDGRSFSGGAYVKPTGQVGRQGTVYVVAGSSGWTSGGTLDHPVMAVSLNLLGSLVLEFQGRVLDGWFIDTEGRARDRFTVAKCPEPDLEITATTVVAVRSEERCNAIAAGPEVTVAPGGALSLRAGNRVVLRDGFSVAAGGRLAIEIDPALAGPP